MEDGIGDASDRLDALEASPPGDGSAVTAVLDAAGSGAITITPVSGGTAVRVLTGTLTANRAVTFDPAADGTTIRLSMLRVTFGTFTISAGGETFTAPTVAEWTRIGGAWERTS